MASQNEAHQSLQVRPRIIVKDLATAYRSLVVLRDLNCTLRCGKTFIMSGSRCGKCTRLRHLVGLNDPAKINITCGGLELAASDAATRKSRSRRLGILYQDRPLWSSMAAAQNVDPSVGKFTGLALKQIQVPALKPLGAGFIGFEDLRLNEISAKTQKRTGLAHAQALDPHTLFSNKPLAGPGLLSLRQFDDLNLKGYVSTVRPRPLRPRSGGTHLHDCRPPRLPSPISNSEPCERSSRTHRRFERPRGFMLSSSRGARSNHRG